MVCPSRAFTGSELESGRGRLAFGLTEEERKDDQRLLSQICFRRWWPVSWGMSAA